MCNTCAAIYLTGEVGVPSDYRRYLAEISEGDERKRVVEEAEAKYSRAQELAQDPDTGLSATHPIRLGLALNVSVSRQECAFMFLVQWGVLTPTSVCCVCVGVPF